jgi:hypothetical protein
MLDLQLELHLQPLLQLTLVHFTYQLKQDFTQAVTGHAQQTLVL